MTTPLPRRALRAAVAVAALSLALTACGGDEDPPGVSSEAPSSESGSATGSGSDITDLGVDADLDAVPEDALVDSLGRAIVISLDGAQEYEVEDGRLTITMDGSSTDNPSACLIATSARDGVGAETTISLRYEDTTLDCD